MDYKDKLIEKITKNLCDLKVKDLETLLALIKVFKE